MNKVFYSFVLAVLLALLAATVAFALFTNGNFETGDFTGWTKTAFINKDSDQPTGAGGSDLSAIVGGPAAAPLSLSDPNTGDKLKYPDEGHYSARVNSELSYSGGGYGKNGNSISQTVSAVLDPTDGLMHVRFDYAAVMVKPADNDHEVDELPYFRIKAVNTSNGGDVIFNFYSYVGEPGKNWLDGIPFDNGHADDAGDRWEYIDWTSVDLVSSAAHPVKEGDVITLTITAAGCSLGGHPGYAYVDDVNVGSGPGPVANLTLAAVGEPTVKPGDQYTYTMSYTTDADVSNAEVSVTLPGHTTFVSSDKACTVTSGVATCNLGALSAGGGSFNFTVLVDKLKKVGIPLTLPAASYSMSATNATTVNGSSDVTADVLTPFADIPLGHWELDYVQSIWAAGITGGCSVSPLMYCPDNNITRGEAAVFIERGMGNFAPTPNPSGMFADVPYPTMEAFTPFIEEFYNDHITSGCAINPLKFCPQDFVTRAQTAVFIERAIGNFAPTPNPTGMFADIPFPGLEAYTPFIEQFYNDGITMGCSVNPLKFCPQDFVSRASMAVFIQRAFSLPLPS